MHLKALKLSNQESYEHVGPKSQAHKVEKISRWRKRDYACGIVTHWFTLIVLSALRRSDNENMLSLVILILRSILTDLQVNPTKPG
nr:hypothetical protein [Tanacetum cinerariifolium]